jgi:hypothetical protein
MVAWEPPELSTYREGESMKELGGVAEPWPVTERVTVPGVGRDAKTIDKSA